MASCKTQKQFRQLQMEHQRMLIEQQTLALPASDQPRGDRAQYVLP